MPLYNRFVEHLILPAGDLLFHTHFMSELRRWRQFQRLSSDRISDLQRDNLAGLLAFASAKIPFYQKLQITSSKDPLNHLSHFPIQKKGTVNTHRQELLQPGVKGLVVEKSSGSSGVQSEVFMSRREQFNVLAIQTYLWEWSGYQLGSPLLQLGMTLKRSGIKSLKDKLLRTTYQEAFRIDEQSVSVALKQFQSNQAFFGGYASGLYAYACLGEELGIAPTFKGVISWGDKLFDHYRHKIETVFNTKVYDIYGSTEGFVVSGECEAGNHHIMTPHVYLELLDEQGNEVCPGEIGRVVVTRLDGFSMPLIRFNLGDLAIKADPSERCSCGKPFPMLKKIIGRDTDIVKTRSGKFLIVHFFTGIFEHINEIRQFRVIQKKLDGITVEYIPRDHFSISALEKIRQQILDYLQEPFQIEFIEVNDIPATASGKPQIIQSLLPNAQSLPV